VKKKEKTSNRETKGARPINPTGNRCKIKGQANLQRKKKKRREGSKGVSVSNNSSGGGWKAVSEVGPFESHQK